MTQCSMCLEGDTQSTKGHCYGVDDSCNCWCTGGPGDRDETPIPDNCMSCGKSLPDDGSTFHIRSLNGVVVAWHDDCAEPSMYDPKERRAV